MQVFHFINEEYGLDDIRRRRLKIATLDDLNDPFELFSIDCSNKDIRQAFHKLKSKLATNRGMICFSRDWHNPVQWSHYADKHRGICLGFEMPDNKLAKVCYTRKRLISEAERLIAGENLNEEVMLKFLTTKYAHWKYENEMRCFTDLSEQIHDNNFYFANFSNQLKLNRVIVGAESSIKRDKLHNALGDLASNVFVAKARLAFKSFRVVRQMKKSLWE